MDRFTPFQTFQFESFTFTSHRYEEYCAGKLISSGRVQIDILVKTNQSRINTYLIGNTIDNKIKSEFEFDTLITLEDRMQLTILPRETNVNDSLFALLKYSINFTREKKEFTQIEPIVGHIFTENMNIIKITFKMTNPERIIEFY